MNSIDRNWLKLVQEMDPFVGRQYRDERGNLFTFFGLVHGDDYYYGLTGPSGLELLSCVVSLEEYGFELLPIHAESRG
jgi:hypothetical protein